MIISIIGDKATISERGDIDKINSGSIEYYQITLSFDESWNNLTKELILVSPHKKATNSIIVNDVCYINAELTGNYRIGFIGYSINYFKTVDTQIVLNKKYYTRSGAEPDYIYTLVENPIQADLEDYYEAKKGYQISTNLISEPVYLGAGEFKVEEPSVPAVSEWETYLQIMQRIAEETERLNVTGDRVIDGVEITFTDRQGNERVEKVNDGEQGPKGDTGDSGVYIGEEYPTDPNVNVWIDTDAEGEEYALRSDVGNKSNLTTTDKTNLVAGINEVNQKANTLDENKQSITDNNLQTTNKSIVSAINEINNNETENKNDIDNINALIPTQATAQNQLGDKEFINSSIATNTAHYIYKTVGTEKLPFDSIAELEAYTGTVTQNDYAFVTGTDSEGNAYYDRYKADVNGTTVTWAKEYRLNNSSFTAVQWAAIQSGITQALVGQISTNQGNIATILADYIKSTDYATSSKPGIISTSLAVGTAIDGHRLYAVVRTYQNYLSDYNTLFISKGTLENWYVGKDIANKTYVQDYVNSLDGSEVAY